MATEGKPLRREPVQVPKPTPRRDRKAPQKEPERKRELVPVR